MKKPAVAIIGAGRVGSVIAWVLHEHGYYLTGVASRTVESAERLARQYGVPASTQATDIIRDANIIFVTTPDRYIGQVVQEIAGVGGFTSGQVILHTSGSLTAEVLEPARKSGAVIGSMHPLQSFANIEFGKIALAGIYFAVDGDEEAVCLAENLVEEFGGFSFRVSGKDRALYHASACIVSNYFVALMHWAAKLYERFGLSPKQASAALMPLVQGTVSNIQQLGAVAALTGPISRGDDVTIAGHMQAFEDCAEKKLYAELGRYTVDVALEKGTINKQQATRLSAILQIDKTEDE